MFVVRGKALGMVLALVANCVQAAPPVSQTQGTLLRMMTQVQQLQEEIRALRGDVEVQSNDIAGIRKRQRDVYLDLDRRLHSLESKPASTAAGVEAAPVQPVSVTSIYGGQPGSTRHEDPAAEKMAFETAFALVKANEYKSAALAFDQFMLDYPAGKYAANALYWRAAISFAMNDFDAALAEFQRVLDQYPDSTKVPDAKLKIGLIHFRREDWAAARATLEGLRSEYPATTAASLAHKQLQRIPR